MRSEICKKCADKSCYGYDREITECVDFQPMTNYDLIISKTPEELADWIASVISYHSMFVRNLASDGIGAECDTECPLYNCCNAQPSDNIEDWLKAPVKEVEV